MVQFVDNACIPGDADLEMLKELLKYLPPDCNANVCPGVVVRVEVCVLSKLGLRDQVQHHLSAVRTRGDFEVLQVHVDDVLGPR